MNIWLFWIVNWCFVQTAFTQRPECFAESVRRPCSGYADKERMFFNPASGSCDTFDYSTCTTGENSFSGWKACEQACTCQQPPVAKPCDWPWTHPMYYFNTQTNSCEEFPKGFCSSNGNYYEHKSACMMACVCSLPLDSGTGTSQTSVYFYNSSSKSCEPFVYSGDGGNANRFASMEACKQECQCGMPLKPGPDEFQCRANFPSYYYNSDTQQCQFFTYGGCGGNNNRFPTEELCNQTCP